MSTEEVKEAVRDAIAGAEIEFEYDKATVRLTPSQLIAGIRSGEYMIIRRGDLEKSLRAMLASAQIVEARNDR